MKMKKSLHLHLRLNYLLNVKLEDSESMDDLRRQLKRYQQKEVWYKRELCKMKFELTTFQAIVRQYRCKAKNIRKLAMASIQRQDMLFEYADAKLESGKAPKEVKSDNEDDKECNKVDYSYIDNELFINKD